MMNLDSKLLRCILMLSIVACSVGCIKEHIECNGKSGLTYRFELPVSISPTKDTFGIGDTIWIEHTFSSKFRNFEDDKEYTLENFDFQTTMLITDLQTTFPATSYVKPELYTLIGKSDGSYIGYSQYQSIGVEYDYKDGQYHYKAAFILDRVGLYVINFFTGLLKGEYGITKCKNETLYIDYATNGKTDNNYEMMRNSEDTSFANLSLEKFNRSGSYCFYIK